MGIYETLQRSSGSIDQIASAFQSFLKNKQDEEKRKKLQNVMYSDREIIKPDVLASLGMNQQEIPIDIANRRPPPTGARPPFTEEPSQTTTEKQFMGVNSKNAMAIAEIMKMTPEQMVKFLSGVQGQEERRARGNILAVPEGTDVIDIGTGEKKYGNVKDFGPRTSVNPSLGKQWIMRAGQKVFDIPGEGDEPYSKPGAPSQNPSLGKDWVMRDGKPVFAVPQEGDQPYSKPTAGEGKISRTVTYVKPDGKQGIKTYSGTPLQVIEQIQARLKALDALAEKSGMGGGSSGFLGMGGSSTWSDFKGGKATIDDLSTGLQGNAAEYSELESQLEDLQSMGGEESPDGGAGENNTYSLGEVRAQYPQLKDRTDEEIIEAYAKQGITIKP